MQVNNRNYSPYFGMLYINNEGNLWLQKQSPEVEDKHEKAFAELVNTKYYHLELGKDGKRTITSCFANRLQGGTIDVKEEPRDEFLHYSATWAGAQFGKLKPGDKYNGSIRFANKEAALNAYNALKEVHGIDRDVLMVKYFDARTKEKEKELRQGAKEKNDAATKANELYEKSQTLMKTINEIPYSIR